MIVKNSLFYSRILVFVLTVVIWGVDHVKASVGDSSPFYQQCGMSCMKENCTSTGNWIKNPPITLRLFQWTCEEDCNYQCMWKTVSAFKKRNWKVPQFNGKWPFARFLGIQEPASSIFSIFNLLANVIMFKRFRRTVRPDSPHYFLWTFFFIVCMNCWFWSTIFHAKDTPLTELMDYVCAFSNILTMCYCMIIRLFNTNKRPINVFFTVIYVLTFANHTTYLAMTPRINYAYNMQLNILIGSFTAITWFMWSIYNKSRLPYVWKCALFVAMNGVFLLLEIYDFPPILWTFDCHALWHLSTAPCITLFYNFIIDDCRHLRNVKFESKPNENDDQNKNHFFSNQSKSKLEENQQQQQQKEVDKVKLKKTQ